MIWVGFRSDCEGVVGSFFNDPDVSVFIGGIVGSDIEIVSEFSDSIIRTEEEMMWVCVGSDFVFLSSLVNQNNLVSLFLSSVGSDIKILIVISVVIVGNEQEMVLGSRWADGNCLFVMMSSLHFEKLRILL